MPSREAVRSWVALAAVESVYTGSPCGDPVRCTSSSCCCCCCCVGGGLMRETPPAAVATHNPPPPPLLACAEDVMDVMAAFPTLMSVSGCCDCLRMSHIVTWPNSSPPTIVIVPVAAAAEEDDEQQHAVKAMPDGEWAVSTVDDDERRSIILSNPSPLATMHCFPSVPTSLPSRGSVSVVAVVADVVQM